MGDPGAWAEALARFDEGRPDLLAAMLGALAADPVKWSRPFGKAPPDVAKAIGEIVAGKRKPETRGRKKGDVPRDVRRAAVERYIRLRDVRDDLLRGASAVDKRHIRADFDTESHAIADSAGMNIETLKKLAQPSQRGTK
ncbi:MAG TPA: hypothetical protein VHC92_13055 [Rhodanobacteraceae bacterium]|nr:hypothetical protein [Rhodanobacteraceae bacterium]